MNPVTAKHMQNAYNRLYCGLRNYIWPVKSVCDIAELEESVYRAFPNRTSVQSALDAVNKDCKDIVKEDKKLRASLIAMQSAIDESDTVYVKLWVPRRSAK